MASLNAPIPSSRTSNNLVRNPQNAIQSSNVHFQTVISLRSGLFSAACHSRTFLPTFSPLTVLFSSTQNNRNSVAFSISQVHSYGTVDYERRPPQPWRSLYRKITMTDGSGVSCSEILREWEEEEGRKLVKWTLCRVVRELRKFQSHKRALEVYEWMTEQRQRFRLNTSDIAIQLDLISKVHGISVGEDYFSKLPNASKDKRTYGALLNAYVQANMKEKAETTLEEMKNKDIALQALPYNVMMTLYMNSKEYQKALSMVSEMRENSISLDVYSYNIWITICGEMGNGEEMEQVLERMKSDVHVIANWSTYSTLASMYIKLGQFDKAENCLKDLELRMTGRDRTSYNYLISLYGSIGNKDDVYRVWNSYKSSFPRILNLGYFTMISSLVRMRDIEGAEAVYEEWLNVKSQYDPRIGNVLIGWYVREGSLEKAERFLEQIQEVGGFTNQNTWEMLAEGYIRQEKISKTLSCMQEAASTKGTRIWQPKPGNVADLLKLCNQKSDPESVDILVEILRNVGCLNLDRYMQILKLHIGDRFGDPGFSGETCQPHVGDANEVLVSQPSDSLISIPPIRLECM